MHNIKDIRNDPNKFKDSLKKRFLDLDLNKLLELDENNRKLIQEKENLEKEKKEISKSKNKDLFEKSKSISKKIDVLENKQKEIKVNLLCAKSNYNLLKKQIEFFKPNFVYIDDQEKSKKLKEKKKACIDLNKSIKLGKEVFEEEYLEICH